MLCYEALHLVLRDPIDVDALPIVDKNPLDILGVLLGAVSLAIYKHVNRDRRPELSRNRLTVTTS